MIVSGNRVRRAWPYSVTVAAAGPALLLADVKSFLKDPPSADDALITALIEAVTSYAERYTGRWFITRTCVTYRDDFFDSLEIRRAPMGSVSAVEYYKDGVLTTVATTVYQVLESNGFARLSLKTGQVWPTDVDAREQAVKITFTAGMAATYATVPDDLQQAMMMHIACLYAERGDCVETGARSGVMLPAMSAVPSGARAIYDMRRIRTIGS